MQIDRMYLNQITIDSGLRFTFQIFSPIKITLCLPSPQDTVVFKRGITNLLFWGTETVHRADHWVRSRISWQLAGKGIALEQLENYEVIGRHLHEYKDVAVNCELKMSGLFDESSAFHEVK